MLSKFRVCKSFKEKRQKDLGQVNRILSENSNIVLLSHGPIKALQNVELRQRLNAIGANMKIVKGSIAKIATSNSPLSSIVAPIKCTSLGVAFSSSADPVLLVKTIREFVRHDSSKLNFLGGLIQAVTLNQSQVEAVADMKTAEQLYVQIISLLSAPASRLISLLSFPAQGIISAAEQYAKFRSQ
jgi:large subunit ribosomal protein L10